MNLFLDVAKRALVAGPRDRTPVSLAALMPTAGASIPFTLYPMAPEGNGVSLSQALTDPELTLGSLDAPTGGRLVLSYDGDSAAALDVETLTPERLAANLLEVGLSVSVTSPARGIYYIATTAVGAPATLAVATEDFLPFGTATLSTVQGGDSDEIQVWALILEMGAIASATSLTSSATVSATVTTVVGGGSTQSEVQRISLSGYPATGWLMVTGGAASKAVPVTATAAEMAAAVLAASGKTCAVTKSGPFAWDILYVTPEDVAALTVSTSGVTGLTGYSGTLDLATTQAASLADGAAIKAELTANGELLYSETMTMRRAVADGALTQWQGREAFVIATMNGALVAGSGITITYNSGSGTFTIASTGGAGGSGVTISQVNWTTAGTELSVTVLANHRVWGQLVIPDGGDFVAIAVKARDESTTTAVFLASGYIAADAGYKVNVFSVPNA